MENNFRQDVNIGDIVAIAEGIGIAIVKLSHITKAGNYIGNPSIRYYMGNNGVTSYGSGFIISTRKLANSFKITCPDIIKKFKDAEQGRP